MIEMLGGYLYLVLASSIFLGYGIIMYLIIILPLLLIALTTYLIFRKKRV